MQKQIYMYEMLSVNVHAYRQSIKYEKKKIILSFTPNSYIGLLPCFNLVDHPSLPDE